MISISRKSITPRSLTALALGLGLLVPSLARADVSAAVAPAGDARDARPLAMRDLDATSSIGIQVQGGVMTVSHSDANNVLIGAVAADGELALGRHVKLFASFPLSGYNGEGDAHGGGHGNLTLGGQLMGGQGDVSAAIGGSVSMGGNPEAFSGLYLDLDVPAYLSQGAVARGFASLRGGSADRFVQLELSYMHFVDEQFEGPDREYHLATAMFGGGFRLDSGNWVHGEVGTLHDFDGYNLYVVELGLRGRTSPGSSGSWGVKLTGTKVDTLKTFGLGFELRNDLAGG